MLRLPSQIKFQDDEGESLKSREGISVTHYPEHFKEEVVAFAKATSQKDAKDRLPKYFFFLLSEHNHPSQTRPDR